MNYSDVLVVIVMVAFVVALKALFILQDIAWRRKVRRWNEEWDKREYPLTTGDLMITEDWHRGKR